MATRTKARRTTAADRAKRSLAGLPQEARAAYAEVQHGVKQLERSIADIQKSLLKAEQKIEADARRRARELHKDATAQLKTLQAKRRQAATMLKQLSAAAGASWEDVRRTAESILADARATAATIAERFRSVLGG